ncbi:MAG: Na+/H+ antiporter subunit E [Anaerolineae bacterium]|nr:Na+/H+ antiporter subunit E [Anaerolineae bacterium]
MIYVWPVAVLTLIYLVLTSNFTLNNIVAGMVVAVIVLLLFRPQSGNLAWKRLPTAVLASIKYIIRLMVDLLVSGIQVARIVLSPSMPINPGIIAIPTRCESDLSRALSAHAITLTPGEMVVEISEDGIMYTHMLDVTDADEHVREAQEMRETMLKKIFE